MRYVATHSRTTCRAFARALSWGNGRPANGPDSSIVDGGSSLDARDDSDVYSEPWSDTVRLIEGRPLVADLGVDVPWEAPFTAVPETRGKSGSRILVIADRCDPASTARTDPLDQCEPIDRTKNPVTLSSAGPPPEAYPH